MPDPAERFLTAAVAPLGDNAELQVMARRELDGCLVDGGTAELAKAAAALERPKQRRKWRIALYAMTAAVSILSLGLLVRMWPVFPTLWDLVYPYIVHIYAPDGGAPVSSPSPATMEAMLGKSLNQEQRLLLFGDTRQTDPPARYKALWNSEPENPAYFADYALRYIEEHGRLPANFLETADKLDPGNAWFTVVAAGVAADGSVERDRSSANADEFNAPSYTILDQSRMNDALKLLEIGARQPRFESYQSRLMAERIARLPTLTDFSSHISKCLYLVDFPSDSSCFLKACEAADAAAWQAGDAGNSEAFLKIADCWEPILLRIIESDSSTRLMDGLAERDMLSITTKRYASTLLPGTDDLHRKWKPVRHRMKKGGDDRIWDAYERQRLKAGMLAGTNLWFAAAGPSEAPSITNADLKPGRLVEHELFTRLCAAAAWLASGLMLLAAALYRRRTNTLVRRLSERLEDLLKPSDWAWILGVGVVLPILFHLVIYRLSPLGARQWNIAASMLIVPSGQVAAMSFLMIVLPVMIARWCLGKRGAMLGWEKGHAWMEWTAVICGAISLPVFGLSFASGKGSEAVMMIAAALLGILVLTGLILGIRAVFSKRPALLRRVTLSRVLVPAYALGMLLMAASMPLYHAAEKRWLAQDRLMEITPEAPALSRYEWEVAQAMRAELLEILNTK